VPDLPCKHCGILESEHPHAFEPAVRPGKCRCNPMHWKHGVIQPVCRLYRDDGVGGNCLTCEHDPECHPEV